MYTVYINKLNYMFLTFTKIDILCKSTATSRVTLHMTSKSRGLKQYLA